MHKVTLEFPITIDGTEHKELTMRRSKVRDRLAVSSLKNTSDEAKEIHLFANLCEVTPKVIEELDEMDYVKIQKVYMSFFDSAAT